MLMKPLTRLAAGAAIALLAALHAPITAAQTSSAQGYPNKPVRLIVSFTPGGFADLVGRSIAQSLQQQWGQPVVVENRPGAAGILATELAAKAVPDGYTLYLATDGPFVINPFIYKTLPYHPLNDFVPVVLTAYVPFVLVTNPSLVKANTVQEFVTAAKAAISTKSLDYASGGAGGPHHLTMEAFKATAGIDLNHIPYKGGVPALQDVLSGQVATMFSVIPTSLAHAKSGKLKILGIAASKRSPLVPDVPTIAESGYPGFEMGAWAGIVAPKGTPQAVVDKIQFDTLKIVRESQFSERLAAAGAEPLPGSADEFAALMRRDMEKNGKLIRTLNIKAD